MVTLVKHEWHSHDRQYAIELDEALLSEIYPDKDEDEISDILKQVEEGEVDIETLIGDAMDNDVEIEWDFQYDDCWTDRKGGYDVTYELGDDGSWHSEPEPDPPTHKCTNCKWEGSEYEADWQWQDSDGNDLDEAKRVCKYCESDTELTEFGIQKKKESDERHSRWAKEASDDEKAVPCYSCGMMHKESELPEIKESGYYCPDCGEGWVMMDSREDELVDESDLEEALDELKEEFEQLKAEPSDTIPAKWPFDNPVVNEEDDSLKASYPPGEYTIRVWGRTREIGVHKISKEQYEYWSDEDHEDDLSDALNENFDYDDAETPEEAQFDMPYYEYQDTESFWGFDEDDTHMTIEDSEGNTIYEGDVASFISEAHGEDDSRWEMTEEIKELYPNSMDEPGHYLFWTQGGKGSCIQTTIVIEEGGVFDPKKFGYTTWDIQGNAIINRLKYDGVELEDEGMDSEHDNWRGQWSEFSVHESK
jgi:predicted RNA-binding Zn-ribbon protein involved in translation (DUF1610 family)